MENTEDQEKKTHTQRKHKAISPLESDDDISSDDLYIPPNGLQNYSSDDSDCDLKKKTKKLKKTKTSLIKTLHEKNENKTYKGISSFGRSVLQRKQKYKRKRSKDFKEKRKAETNVPVLSKKLNQKPSLGRNSIIGKLLKI